MTLKSITFFAILFLNFNCLSQQKNQNWRVETYVSIPNSGSSFFRMIELKQHWGKISGFGPLGIGLYTYKNPKFQMGLDVCYSQTSLIFDTIYTQGMNTRYDFRKLGVIIQNQLVLIKHNKMSLISQIGLGFGMGKVVTNVQHSKNNIPKALYSPFCFRLGLVLHYNLASNFYLRGSMGIGQGGLVNIGLSYSFQK